MGYYHYRSSGNVLKPSNCRRLLLRSTSPPISEFCLERSLRTSNGIKLRLYDGIDSSKFLNQKPWKLCRFIKKVCNLLWHCRDNRCRQFY